MPQVVIIGAGGHGREVLEILLTMAEAGDRVEPLGFVDEDASRRGQIVDGYPILGDFGWFDAAPARSICVVCAIGTPRVCQRVVGQARARGLEFLSVISPHAWISRRANLGTGVIIFPGVTVNTGAQIGDYVTVNTGATISHDASVGSYANINPGVHLAGNVTIGEGCYLGMGTNVIQGRTIGDWTVTGAGAAVIKDLPPCATAVGVPARVVKFNQP